MTVLEAIQKSAGFLAKKGVDSPRLQSELLLAHTLGVPRLNLYLNFERTLSAKELDATRELVKRRGAREPLQHLTGSTSFCGLEMKVNRHVLVPRPETEILAERARQFLAALPGASPAALDLGTGSGCLAIHLAAHIPAAKVLAVDISPAALVVARENATRHRVADRIGFFAGDAFAPLPPGLAFDLVVCNPPYIASGEIAGLQPEVRDFDPHVALDGGEDGLDFYRRLAVEAAPFLRVEGRLMVELGDGQGDLVREIFTARGWTVESVEPDLSGRIRLLVAQRGSAAQFLAAAQIV